MNRKELQDYLTEMHTNQEKFDSVFGRYGENVHGIPILPSITTMLRKTGFDIVKVFE